jgi:putative spermidine/putrescine transport system substrate-binding protein
VLKNMPRSDATACRAAALVVLLTSISAALSPPAQAVDRLTVASWGGTYAASERTAYFAPFTADTGIPVKLIRYAGGIEQVRAQVSTGQTAWDVADLAIADNMQACDEGLLEPIDHDRLRPAPDGTKATEDFIPGALTECGVAHLVTATVVAYNTAAFPGEQPSRVSDLFDLERFPGRRALEKSNEANLEWALLSYGVPRQELYDLLSTERGLRLAFARLDRIREHIVWWTDGQTPVRLLAQGTVVMASGSSGRFVDAAVVHAQPVAVIWDGQLYDYRSWGILRGTPHRDAARALVRFASDPRRMAALASRMAFGPTRHSAAGLVTTHPDTGADMRYHLPSYPANQRGAIRKDHEWYARTGERLKQRFQAWLEDRGADSK